MLKNKAVILAIESSCDETSAAVVINGRQVLSNVISSQINIHRQYGGVVPEIASRKHIENIDNVVKAAMDEAGIDFSMLSAIGVTYGPGLVGALLVGVNYAKALAFGLGLPIIPVNHIEGHIAANYIEHTELEPPFVCLVVSGGHTNLIKINSYSSFEIMGQTLDDAAGEAYDKIARSLDLPYPGGPKIDEISKKGNPKAVMFPRVMLEDGSLDFSFSGLKSSVLNYLNKARLTGLQISKADIAASFQQAVIDVLAEKALMACDAAGCKKLAVCGGVSANTSLRARLKRDCHKHGISLYIPSPILCTDNGAMIGSAAYYEYIEGNFGDMSLNAVPGLKIKERRY